VDLERSRSLQVDQKTTGRMRHREVCRINGIFQMMFVNQHRRLISSRVLIQRLSTGSTQSVDVNSKMKKLIDSQQYRDALALFDRQAERFTDASLCLALEASTRLKDDDRGMRIHKQLSKQATTDSRTQNALIRFYSRSSRFSYSRESTIDCFASELPGYRPCPSDLRINQSKNRLYLRIIVQR
jgi:hypothetical protein